MLGRIARQCIEVGRDSHDFYHSLLVSGRNKVPLRPDLEITTGPGGARINSVEVAYVLNEHVPYLHKHGSEERWKRINPLQGG